MNNATTDQGIIMQPAPIETILRGKLEVYRQAWLHSDIQGFASLWDPTYPRLTYMPMERASIMRDWDSILRYWQTILPMTKMDRWDVGEVVIDMLTPQIAWVFCEHAFAYRVSDGSQDGLQAYEARTTHVFRLDDSVDWKVIHYEDSIQWFASSDAARRTNTPS